MEPGLTFQIWLAAEVLRHAQHIELYQYGTCLHDAYGRANLEPTVRTVEHTSSSVAGGAAVPELGQYGSGWGDGSGLSIFEDVDREMVPSKCLVAGDVVGRIWQQRFLRLRGNRRAAPADATSRSWQRWPDSSAQPMWQRVRQRRLKQMQDDRQRLHRRQVHRLRSLQKTLFKL